MAALANTQLTTMSVGNREELSDVVSRITPEDTPIYSDISKATCKSVHPEWETDELRPPKENKHPEGDEYAYDGITPPRRVGNYTQIFRDSFIISRTQETVDEAGNVQKRKYQKLKTGVALRKDVELGILTNNGSVAGNVREFGALPTWMETNVSRGAGGANGGFDINTGLTVPSTNGTQRAFSKALLDDVMQQGYESGADFRNVYVSPYVKSVFVTFMSDANVAPFRMAVTNGDRNSIIANADIYEGPYGKVFIKPNRVMATNAGVARNAFALDTSKASFLWLRKLAEDTDVTRTGDADKCVIVGEGTLKVANEAGIGVISDLFGLTAST
ncbi:DUF5309 domain-containing protein [Xanthobacteraceae bacterium A53D]